MPFRFSFPRVLAALVGAGLMVGAAPPAARAEMTTAQRSEFEAVIKDYLIKNPEVIRDALVEMDRRDKANDDAARTQAVAAQASLIFNSQHQAVVGNPNGKVTLVEFSDYNCPYCKKSLEDVARLMKEEPDLRLVLKDFPVLGPGSVEAAQIAAALRSQFKGDKYWQFHQKLLSARGQVTKATALGVAKDMGADMDKLAKDVDSPTTKASIDEVMKIADALNLTGTPSFVLGNDVIVGAVGYDSLKEKVENVKKCGKTACG